MSGGSDHSCSGGYHFNQSKRMGAALTKLSLLAAGIAAVVWILDAFVFEIQSSAVNTRINLGDFQLMNQTFASLSEGLEYHMANFIQDWGYKTTIPFALLGAFHLREVKLLKAHPHRSWYFFGYVAVLLIYPYTHRATDLCFNHYE